MDSMRVPEKLMFYTEEKLRRKWQGNNHRWR